MIKVDIISGFLGSGKTTLIRKLLKSYSDEKVIIIENEFGEIGIDGEIIKGDGYEVIELQNGCICCSIKLSFTDTISNIIEDLNPERIIIEPTGIGMLSEIIEIMNKPYLKEKCIVTSLVTVVDSINYFDYLDSFGYFFEDQIVNAATLILSKTQHVDDKNTNDIINSLRELNPKAYIISEDWNNLSSNQILKLLQGDILVDLEDICYTKDIFKTPKNISSISIKTSKTYTKEEIENVLDSLSKGNDGKILRAKGFLKSNDGNLEFNYTNGYYTINKSTIQDCGKLCIIGSNLNKDNIKIIFK